MAVPGGVITLAQGGRRFAAPPCRGDDLLRVSSVRRVAGVITRTASVFEAPGFLVRVALLVVELRSIQILLQPSSGASKCGKTRVAWHELRPQAGLSPEVERRTRGESGEQPGGARGTTSRVVLQLRGAVPSQVLPPSLVPRTIQQHPTDSLRAFTARAGGRIRRRPQEGQGKVESLGDVTPPPEAASFVHGGFASLGRGVPTGKGSKRRGAPGTPMARILGRVRHKPISCRSTGGAGRRCRFARSLSR